MKKKLDKFWQILIILTILNNFWQCWQMLIILTIFTVWYLWTIWKMLMILPFILLTIFHQFDNCKDNPEDFWHLRHCRQMTNDIIVISIGFCLLHSSTSIRYKVFSEIMCFTSSSSWHWSDPYIYQFHTSRIYYTQVA